MKKFLKVAVCCLLILCISGCSFLIAPQQQMITINGKPHGAEVIVNGQFMNTPASVQIPANAHLNIRITKKGFAPYVITQSPTLNHWGMLDIVGGFFWLVPFVGLLAPGAFHHQQTNFFYSLAPEK